MGLKTSRNHQNHSVGDLGRALRNDPEDLPGIEAMTYATGGIATAVGHQARWCRGCDCHSEILQQQVARKTTTKLLEEAGLPEGHCPLMGRRLVHLVHGGVETIKSQVRDAGTDQYNQALLELREDHRAKVVSFETHVKARVVSSIGENLQYLLGPPVTITGMMGMYFGFSIPASVEFAKGLSAYWETHQNDLGVRSRRGWRGGGKWGEEQEQEEKKARRRGWGGGRGA